MGVRNLPYLNFSSFCYVVQAKLPLLLRPLDGVDVVPTFFQAGSEFSGIYCPPVGDC